MEELIKKLIEAGKKDALSSKEAALTAAVELGYAREEAAEILKNADGFPMDDEDLDAVTGGWGVPHPRKFNTSANPGTDYYECLGCGKTFEMSVMFFYPQHVCPYCDGKMIRMTRYD